VWGAPAVACNHTVDPALGLWSTVVGMVGRRFGHWAMVAGLWSCSPSGGEQSPSNAASNSAPLLTASAVATVVPSASASLRAEVESVFPVDNQPPLPLAERYCSVLHDLPVMRRRECCDDRREALFTKECSRMLSYSLRSGATSLAEDSVAKCEAAYRTQLEGCGWVGAEPPQAPTECRELLTGTRKRSELCRSSLECAVGDSCAGLSATNAGVCSAPKAAGGMCQTAIDSLATYLFNGDASHPECAGVCDKLRCRDAAAIGATCSSTLECGAGRRCSKGTCVNGPLASLSQPCSDDLPCAEDLRCIDRTCREAQPEGAPCTSDLACLGGCDSGKCGKRCVVAKTPDFSKALSPRSASPPAPRR
jgi:hypothetical protein